MKKIIIYRWIIGLIIFSLSACNKDNSSLPGGNFLSWYAFKKDYINTTQTFNPSVTNAFSINGAQGTKIDFPAGSFVDYYTGAVITGGIDFTLQEINSRKDLLLNGLMIAPVDNNQWIVGGSLQNIMASQNGNAVKLNPALPAGSVVVNLPSATKAGGGLFKYFVGAGPFTWTNGGAANGNAIYNFSIDQMKMFGMLSEYYSVAKPDVAANAQVTVKVNYEDAGYNPNQSTNDQVTFVKIIYKNAPSVVWLAPFNYNSSSASGSVTAGRDAIIVAYSGGPIPGTQTSTPLYFGTLNVTLQAGQTYTLDLKKITKPNLDAILSNI